MPFSTTTAKLVQPLYQNQLVPKNSGLVRRHASGFQQHQGSASSGYNSCAPKFQRTYIYSRRIERHGRNYLATDDGRELEITCIFRQAALEPPSASSSPFILK